MNNPPPINRGTKPEEPVRRYPPGDRPYQTTTTSNEQEQTKTTNMDTKQTTTSHEQPGFVHSAMETTRQFGKTVTESVTGWLRKATSKDEVGSSKGQKEQVESLNSEREQGRMVLYQGKQQAASSSTSSQIPSTSSKIPSTSYSQIPSSSYSQTPQTPQTSQTSQKPEKTQLQSNLDYYQILEIEKTATQSEIKKAYFRLAKIHHPDRSKNNSSERFKQISEAYQILSSPKDRAFYDKHGVSPSNADFLDPHTLFQQMFGGTKFAHIFGELSILDTEAQQSGQVQQSAQEKIVPLVVALLNKIKTLEEEGPARFRLSVTQEALDLMDAPGGRELVGLVGYVYAQESRQFLGGFGGFWAQIEERSHRFGAKFSAIRSVVKAQMAAERIEQGKSVDKEADEKIAMESGLAMLWKVGKLEIEDTLRAVCETVLGDKAVTKEEKRKRAEAIGVIGEIFGKMAKEEGKGRKEEKGEFVWPPKD